LYGNCNLIKNSRAITVKGWTPEEAYQKLHLELPKIGVFQEIDLKSIQTMTDKKYLEKIQLRKSIRANINMIATHHCKIDNMFAITALIPEGGVNYYSDWIKESYQYDPSDKNWFYRKFWTFEQAKRYCGDQDYSLISLQAPGNLTVQGGRIVHKDDYLSMVTYVICGSNWTAKIHNNASDKRYGIYVREIEHSGRKYTQWYALHNGQVIMHNEASDNMELQMLQNAIEGR
jgi:hypothetical protein